MCTAVFCGHARGEKCPHPANILVKLASGTQQSGLGAHHIIKVCNQCWVNLERNLPGFFNAILPESRAG
jgi:hypothetical protein